MQKKVSVVIPIYNVQEYVEACLKSVIKQTLKEIEIICVDDKSTDFSLEIVKKYQKQDARIVIIESEKNGGLSYARNLGSSIANGEYIYFLDSDDTIDKSMLEELYQIAHSDDLDVVFFDSIMFFEQGMQAKDTDLFCAKKSYDEILTGKQFLSECYKENDIREPVWIQFYKKQFLQENKIDFYNGILHEDLLFTFKILMKAERLRCINKKYHNYRIRKNAITSSKCSENHIAGLAITYWEIMKNWEKEKCKQEVDKAVNHYLDRVSWKMMKYCENFENIELVDNVLENSTIKKMFHIVLEQRMKSKESILYVDWANVDWKYLCSFEKIVIYGAGIIGKEALRQIGEGHSVSCFAVTERQNLRYVMGLPVYQIDELPEEMQEAIIVVAVKAFQSKMKNTVEKLGYKNVMVLPLLK